MRLLNVLKIDGCNIESVKLPAKDVTTTLHALQDLIGGYIEVVRIAEDATLLVDEEGLLKGLSINIQASSLAMRKLAGKAALVGMTRNDIGEIVITDYPMRYEPDLKRNSHPRRQPGTGNKKMLHY